MSATNVETDTSETSEAREANVALVRRLIEGAFNRGDLDLCDQLFSPDVIEHQRGNGSGIPGVKEVITTLRSWFDDFRMEVEEVAAQGDLVWFRNRATGTNTGSVMGFPATHRTIDVTVMDIVRIKDGRIVEHWGVPDQLGVMLQLGLLAPPGPPTV